MKSAEKRILTKYQPGTVITNEDAGSDVIYFLPAPQIGRSYEVLQLSKYRIALDTNDPEVCFLQTKRPQRLIIAGSDSAYGKSLSFEAYRGNWRIVSTTLLPTQLTFEER